MKKLEKLTGAKTLGRNEQKNISGGRNPNGPCSGTGYDYVSIGNCMADQEPGFQWYNGGCIGCW